MLWYHQLLNLKRRVCFWCSSKDVYHSRTSTCIWYWLICNHRYNLLFATLLFNTIREGSLWNGEWFEKIGNQTIKLNSNPKIISTYSIVGPKEGQGPLGEYFHEVISDDTLGKDSFEKAESEMMYTAIKGQLIMQI